MITPETNGNKREHSGFDQKGYTSQQSLPCFDAFYLFHENKEEGVFSHKIIQNKMKWKEGKTKIVGNNKYGQCHIRYTSFLWLSHTK